jgi:predicted amidophosphoribosyltransferase
MPRKGICIRHKVLNRYLTSHKRCKKCDLFIKWDGLWCPCCGYKLRTRRRNSKFKAKLREQERAIEEAKKITIFFRSYSLSVKKSVMV